MFSGFTLTSIIAAFYLISIIIYFIPPFMASIRNLGLSFHLPHEEFLMLYRRRTAETFVLLAPAYILLAAIFLLVYSKIKGRHHWALMYEPISDPRVSVALTAYNDEASIFGAVRDFLSQPNVVDVVVVDNNSVDKTASLALQAGARAVKETRQGYGYACIRGLKEALSNKEANIVVLAEGDGTFANYDIGKILTYLDNVDLVLGTRVTQELTSKDSQMDWFLVWGNMFLAKLIQLKFWNVRFGGNTRLTDVGCTMRGIRREALEKIVDELWIGGMHFSPHMIVTAMKKSLKVVEVPITFRKRKGKSKGAGGNRWRAAKIGFQMLWYILTS